MAFCTNCGQRLGEKVKFCANCGTATDGIDESGGNKRKTVYEGDLRKCPSCGEVLPSFTLKCPACGYEVRGASAASSVRDFSVQLSSATSEKQKETIIRSFPIPNTKEDILEFVVLASSNIERNIDSELSGAWQVKFEQAYQKADMLFKDDVVFLKIQDIYEQINTKIVKNRQAKKMRKIGSIMSELMPILPNLMVPIVWLLSLFILFPVAGLNSKDIGDNGYYIVFMLDLLVGVFLVPPFVKSESGLPRTITVSGLMLLILVLTFICGKNLTHSNLHVVILFLVVVCGILILIRIIRYKPKTIMKNNTISFIFTLCVLVLFIVAYLLSSLVAAFGGKSDSQSSMSEENSYVDACIEKGFNVDYSRSAGSFSADNEYEDSLQVIYKGNNIMYILVCAGD